MRDRIRIAVVVAALCALPPATAGGQSTFRETGSVTVGGAVVWVRGTNTGVVQLFVGHGFHDAFARPHEVNASALARWIDSVRVIAPARDSAAAEAQVRASVLSADVTMMRRAGGPFSGLRLLITGEDPIAIPEPTASDFLVVLDSAARVAASLSAPAPAPVPVPTVADAPAPAPLDASTAQPAPELVLPAPSAPVMLLASRVEIVPPPAIVPVPTPVPAAAPAPARMPEPVAVAAPPVAEPSAPVPTPAPDTVVTPPHVDAPADKLIHTPLGPFTIPGALLADRDKEAQYCYTQLGLKYNPDLKGEITVKVTLAGDGSVQDAVVTKRSWQGISAGEVEACVRALAHDWTFPASDAAVTSGAKLLTFSFAP